MCWRRAPIRRSFAPRSARGGHRANRDIEHRSERRDRMTKKAQQAGSPTLGVFEPYTLGHRFKGSLRTMERLILAVIMCASVPLLAQSVHVDGQYFTAKGKWKSTTGKPGDEITSRHVVEIDCFKATNECIEATAEVVGNAPEVNIEYYTVLNWDANGLTARNDAPVCVTNQLIINFEDKSVTAIDGPKVDSAGFKDSCKTLTLDHTQTYKLIDRF